MEVNATSYYEQSLIQAIRAGMEDVKGVEVKAYPNDPSSYAVKAPNGEILVRYDGSNFGQKSLDDAWQERTMKLEIIVISRNLNTTKTNVGMYELLDKVRAVVYEFHMEGIGGKARLVAEDLLGERQGIWQFGLKVEMDSVYYTRDGEMPLATLKELHQEVAYGGTA